MPVGTQASTTAGAQLVTRVSCALAQLRGHVDAEGRPHPRSGANQGVAVLAYGRVPEDDRGNFPCQVHAHDYGRVHSTEHDYERLISARDYVSPKHRIAARSRRERSAGYI